MNLYADTINALEMSLYLFIDKGIRNTVNPLKDSENVDMTNSSSA